MSAPQEAWAVLILPWIPFSISINHDSKVPSPQGHAKTDDTQRTGDSTVHSLSGERQVRACPFSISEVELVTLCPVSKEGRD